MIAIIDGYNVIRRTPRWREHFERSLAEARELLMAYCAAWKSRRKDITACTVVFDGDSSVGGVQNPTVSGVTVIYTQTGEEADARIVSIVSSRGGDGYMVVTDDAELAASCRSRGAKTLSVAEFAKEPSGRGKRSNAGGSGDDKAGLSAAAVKEINEALIRELGLD